MTAVRVNCFSGNVDCLMTGVISAVEYSAIHIPYNPVSGIRLITDLVHALLGGMDQSYNCAE